jgi:hypothetical protein
LSIDHQKALEVWVAEAVCEGDQDRQQQLEETYTFDLWAHQVPEAYPDPAPACHADLSQAEVPTQNNWHMPLDQKMIPIDLLPTFSPEVESENLEAQAELLLQMALEEDKFGDTFFDEKDNEREMQETYKAMGKSCSLCLKKHCLCMAQSQVSKEIQTRKLKR